MKEANYIDYPKFKPGAKFPVHHGNTVFTPDHDLQLLYWLGEQTTRDIVEIGCNKGITTALLADAFMDKTIIGVDCAEVRIRNRAQAVEQPSVTEMGMHARNRSNVLLVDCDSAGFSYEAFAPDASMIFIDGDHTFGGVKLDSERALAFLSKQPSDWVRIIVWHDAFVAEHPTAPWIGVGRYLLSDHHDMDVKFIRNSNVAFTIL